LDRPTGYRLKVSKVTIDQPSDAVDKHIGYRLRQKRLDKGLNLADMAYTIGLSECKLQEIEAGRARLPPASLLAAAITLNLDVGYFFDGAPPPAMPRSLELNESDISSFFALPEAKPLVSAFCSITTEAGRQSVVEFANLLRSK
jgi:transcriptional regulator with XRE-family HTH domain